MTTQKLTNDTTSPEETVRAAAGKKTTRAAAGKKTTRAAAGKKTATSAKAPARAAASKKTATSAANAVALGHNAKPSSGFDMTSDDAIVPNMAKCQDDFTTYEDDSAIKTIPLSSDHLGVAGNDNDPSTPRSRDADLPPWVARDFTWIQEHGQWKLVARPSFRLGMIKAMKAETIAIWADAQEALTDDDFRDKVERVVEGYRTVSEITREFDEYTAERVIRNAADISFKMIMNYRRAVGVQEALDRVTARQAREPNYEMSEKLFLDVESVHEQNRATVFAFAVAEALDPHIRNINWSREVAKYLDWAQRKNTEQYGETSGDAAIKANSATTEATARLLGRRRTTTA